MNFYNPANKNFTSDLLLWDARDNDRKMPWKGERDPYRIWLSEVILQQTRVEQGLDYYQRFRTAFPTVHDLAAAPEEVVMKMWEGLGYYSRCRNLHEAAKYVSRELNGEFPKTFEKVLALKGVGEYTASAIVSFAYDLPYAVVDGNVYRVLSRVFGMKDAIDTGVGQKVFKKVAAELIDKNEPGRYNQAIMDHGATICKPVLPLCDVCPFNKYCVAFRTGTVGTLPVRSKKIRVRSRWFYYIVIEHDDNILLRRRTAKDIWNGLYEFVLIEKEMQADERQVESYIQKGLGISGSQYLIKGVSPELDQKLTHQRIRGRFIRIHLKELPKGLDGQFVPRNELRKFAFPRFINEYIRDHYMN